jgi:hypothetical protein
MIERSILALACSRGPPSPAMADDWTRSFGSFGRFIWPVHLAGSFGRFIWPPASRIKLTQSPSPQTRSAGSLVWQFQAREEGFQSIVPNLIETSRCARADCVYCRFGAAQSGHFRLIGFTLLVYDVARIATRKLGC